MSTPRPMVLVCDECDAEHRDRTNISRCDCGGLLAVRHAPEFSGGALRDSFDVTHPSGVWRFGTVVHSRAAAFLVSHPEGNTPLIARPALERFTNTDGLLIKHEGHNPTGSFKDRGMTVAITQAARLGAGAVACASTGNTSASLAAYAAQAGIPAVVLVPRGQVTMAKLSQAIAYGAKVLEVNGDFDACLRLVEDAEHRLGWYLANSINPFRIEGQKTIILELLRQLDWQPPDWIIFPAGNLGNCSAFGKALIEAQAWGLIDRLPRLAAVQAAGAAPFAAAYQRDFDRLEPVVADTLATAIRIGNPASYSRAVRAIRDTDGVATACSDHEILAAKAAIDRAGVGCEPASAAALAGLRQLRERGVIAEGERVVAILTGNMLKDPGIIETMHGQGGLIESPNQVISIEANLTAVEQALS